MTIVITWLTLLQVLATFFAAFACFAAFAQVSETSNLRDTTVGVWTWVAFIVLFVAIWRLFL